MRRWIKWYGIDWINSTARDELIPAERATFLDFVCLASYPGCAPGTFKVASWEALARKLNTPLEVVLSTRDKCLPNRITVFNHSEGLLVTISNWDKYQAPLKSDNTFGIKPSKSDNKTLPQRRGEERRGRRDKSTPPHPTDPRPAFVVPEDFKPLTTLPGYKNRNHEKAFANIRAACVDANVDVAEVVKSFAAEYNILRHTYAWVDPVAALKGRPLAIAISRVLEGHNVKSNIIRTDGSAGNRPASAAEGAQAPEVPGPFAKYR